MTSRFGFISAHHAAYGVKRLCRILNISRSGFYRLRRARSGTSHPSGEGRTLAERIRAVHADSGGTYGSPRVDTELREAGMRVNRKRTEHVMREHRIIGRHHRRRCRTTMPDPAAAPVPNLIKRDFTTTAPDVRWVGDITYLPVGGRWMYLATAIDVYSRRLIGYSMADHMPADLVIDALNAAVRTRGGRVRQAMGAVGSSADNALTEAFFATLKQEILPAWPSSPG